MQNVMQVSKIRSMIISSLSVLGIALLFSCSKSVADVPKLPVEEATAANGASNSSSGNTIHAVPFENTLFVPCANGGAGEDVALTGFTNFIYQLSWTDHGFTLVYHDNVHHVTGIGVSSGESFVASGGTNGIVMGSWVNNQWIGTTVRKMRIIGQHTNFSITYKYHITVTPNGNVTVNSSEQTAGCN